MRRFAALLALAVLAAWPTAAVPPPPSSSEGRHVVMISIDGLKPDYYLRADELGLAIPNLRRLMREGAPSSGAGIRSMRWT